MTQLLESNINTVCQWNSIVFNSLWKLNSDINMSDMCAGKEFQIAGLPL